MKFCQFFSFFFFSTLSPLPHFLTPNTRLFHSSFATITIIVGFRGAPLGFALGGILAMPITLIEIAMRLYVTDDDLMPSVVLFADVPNPNMRSNLTTQLIEGEELEKELDKLETTPQKLR